MNDFIKGFLCVTAVFIISILFYFGCAGYDSLRKDRYSAWIKLTGRNDITYEEFKALGNLVDYYHHKGAK